VLTEGLSAVMMVETVAVLLDQARATKTTGGDGPTGQQEGTTV
jgi:hypothetical protein